MNSVIEAVNFAAIKHRDQRRKDESKSPYINHPIHVMRTLSICGVTDSVVLSAAVLHDTIEDTKTTEEELKENFGEEITNIVLECSDDKKIRSTAKRKQLQLEHSTKASNKAKLVKAADKYSNLSDLIYNPPPSWSKEEIRGYFIWSYCVFNNIKGVNKKLDTLLEDIFKVFDFSKLSEKQIEEELNHYYSIINKSD